MDHIYNIAKFLHVIGFVFMVAADYGVVELLIKML